MRNLITFNKMWIAVCLAGGLTLSGCMQPPQQPITPPTELDSARNALEGNQPDIAIADAQSYLHGEPGGPYSADAWYIQGRGYEQKIAGSTEEMRQNLFNAKSSYLEALQANPSPPLEGDIRASLSNVAYFQDQFPQAIEEASAAMKLVSSTQIKGSLQFRIGLSEQRMGRFTDADQTFRQIEQRYHGSDLGEAAREHEGIRSFYVQLATYNKPESAQAALSQLATTGTLVSSRTDTKGNTIIDAGPFASYEDARGQKDQLQNSFPDAVIVP